MITYPTSGGNWSPSERVKNAARNNWRTILTALGIPAGSLTGRHGPCPVCGGRDRFRFDDKRGNGTFFCSHCEPGDGFRLVQLYRNWDFAQALRAVESVLGGGTIASPVRRTFTTTPEEAELRRIRWMSHLVEHTWQETVPISPGDPAYLYLTETRRLRLETIPSVLRFHPNLEFFDNVDKKSLGAFPALVAQVQAPDGSMCAVHRIYLTDDGRKAQVPTEKKLLARRRGASSKGTIRLFDPTDVLGIAEGIETALACHVETHLPVWSTIAAYGIEKFVVPAGVEKVVIFADNDRHKSATGERVAKSLKNKLLHNGLKVKVLVPPHPGDDWADVVAKESTNG